jgi:hypothetical protein
MNIACALGIHKWSGCACVRCGTVSHQWDNCKCRKCGEIREEHTWNGCLCTTCHKILHIWDRCKCSRCGKQRDEEHEWVACKCKVCGKQRDQEHVWVACKCEVCGRIRHEWEGPKCATCGTTRPLSEQEFRIALHSADMPLVEACVESPMGANANLAEHIRSQEFLAPLHIVAHLYGDSRFEEQKRRGLLEIAGYLLDHGADPNSQVWPGGDTPLHRVNYPKDTPFAELLFKHDADPSIKNYFSKTAAEDHQHRLACLGRTVGPEDKLFLDFLATGKRPQGEEGHRDAATAKKSRGLSRAYLSDHLRSTVGGSALDDGPIEEFRKGQADFRDWGGSVVGTEEWVVGEVAARLNSLEAVSIDATPAERYEWQKANLSNFCLRIQAARADGTMAAGYIAKLRDIGFGAFGFGLASGERKES